MIKEKTPKDTISSSITNSDFGLLLSVISKSNLLSYNDDDLSDFVVDDAILNDPSDILLLDNLFSFSLEEVSRDVLWSPQVFIKDLKTAVSENPNSDDTAKIMKSFGIDDGVSIIFADSSPGDNGDYYYENWISNMDKGWIIKISGSMGSFSDDNYDAYIDVEFSFSPNKAAVEKKLARRLSSWASSKAGDLQAEIDRVLNSIPANMKEKASSEITRRFSESKFFAPILAEKQRDEISSSIQDVIVNKKSKKVSKI